MTDVERLEQAGRIIARQDQRIRELYAAGVLEGFKAAVRQCAEIAENSTFEDGLDPTL